MAVYMISRQVEIGLTLNNIAVIQSTQIEHSNNFFVMHEH